VRQRAVDQNEPDRDEGQVGPETHALGEGPDHQRGRDDGEHALEDHEDVLGDGSPECFGRDAGEAELAEATDEGVPLGEGQAVSEQDPEHSDDTGGDQALHQDAENVLGPDQPAVEERQARNRHHQHQGRAGHHPGGVAGTERVLRPGGLRQQKHRQGGGKGRREAAGSGQ
jgi:hypothetical protein